MEFPSLIELDNDILLKKVIYNIDKNNLKNILQELLDVKIELFLGMNSDINKEIIYMYNNIEKKSHVYYAIYKQNSFVGLFYLYDIMENFKRANLSLGFIQKKRGFVLTKTRIKTLLNKLFDLGFIRLGLEIEDTNADSLLLIKKLEKIGFKYEGKLRDNYGENINSNIWSILKRDFKY